MTVTDLDLDALLDALVARAAARAVERPLFNQAGEEVTALASTGRLVVHPGDVVASVWGNTTYDQTIQVYDTTAARDSQWPTPKDGAMAYTVDTATLWLRRSGAWAPVPPAQASGSANCVFSAASASSQPIVTFPAGRFATPPKVMAVANTAGSFWVSVANITATQCTVRCFQAAASTITIEVDWYATAAV